MKLLREVTEGRPIAPHGGWNVGHLANLGLLLSCDDFSIRLDLDNLNRLFDLAEDDEIGDIKDQNGDFITVSPYEDGIVLSPIKNPQFVNGLILDLDTLKEMGIEQYEEEEDSEPEDEFDSLESEDIIESEEFDALSDNVDEGIKRAFRRSGKKIKRGYRVTSGFRKGRVVSSPSGAFKPRKKASTRMKMKIAARKKKVIRVLKGKRTRRKSSSKRLVRMNKRIK